MSEGGRVEVFRGVDVVEPQWVVFADGVDYFHGKTSSPRIEFYALRVDLHSSNLKIVVRNGADSLSTRVTSFVRDNNLIAGINALPFDVVSSKEGQPIKSTGLVVSDRVQLSPAVARYDALVFFHDGQHVHAVIANQGEIYSTANIINAVGGFHQVLAGGEPAERTIDRKERHPRSGAGISANGRFLFLLVIDGRRPGSVGATERELALLLRSLGSADGINFDGGGSSALALRYHDGSVKTVNTPIHGGIPGTERAVAGCLGIEGR